MGEDYSGLMPFTLVQILTFGFCVNSESMCLHKQRRVYTHCHVKCAVKGKHIPVTGHEGP
jgi:hypothetical protein